MFVHPLYPKTNRHWTSCSHKQHVYLSTNQYDSEKLKYFLFSHSPNIATTMCQFTRVLWSECNHFTLSCTPEHTHLCLVARSCHLRQGIDHAPASCHPLSTDTGQLGDENTNDAFVQINAIFSFCDACKADPKIAPGVQKFADYNAPVVEEVGEYSDDDGLEVAKQRDLLLSCEQQSLAAIRAFDTLVADRETQVKAAIDMIQNQFIRDILLTPGTTRYTKLFVKSFVDCAPLLQTLDLYAALHVPTHFFSSLFGLIRDKIQHAAKRLRLFLKLTAALSNLDPETNDYEACINKYADKLARRLGHPSIPDTDAFAHLVAKSPRYVRKRFETREEVRRCSIAAHASETAEPYRPRSSFGAGSNAKPGRNAKGLSVDVDAARRPRPEALNLKSVPEIEVVRFEGVEGRVRLSALGVGRGPWGVGVLQPSQGLALDSRAERSTARGGPELSGRVSEGSDETVREEELAHGGNMLPRGAMFMGVRLSDTEDEVSSNGDCGEEKSADGQGDNRQDAALTSEGQDEDGRIVKKRKHSA